MTTRIRVPGGTLKIKKYQELRSAERLRQVPVIAVAGIYLVWWSRSAQRRAAAEREKLLQEGAAGPDG